MICIVLHTEQDFLRFCLIYDPLWLFKEKRNETYEDWIRNIIYKYDKKLPIIFNFTNGIFQGFMFYDKYGIDFYETYDKFDKPKWIHWNRYNKLKKILKDENKIE